jgi:hypothetical protein
MCAIARVGSMRAVCSRDHAEIASGVPIHSARRNATDVRPVTALLAGRTRVCRMALANHPDEPIAAA